MSTTPVLARQIVSLRDQGYSCSEIARELKVSPERITCALRNAQHQNRLEARLEAMEALIEEILVLVRQLSRLPASEVERRIRQLELGREAKLATNPEPPSV